MNNLDIKQNGDIMSEFIPSWCSDGSSGQAYCVQTIVSQLSLQSDCNIVQKISLTAFISESKAPFGIPILTKTEILIVIFSTMETLRSFYRKVG